MSRRSRRVNKSKNSVVNSPPKKKQRRNYNNNISDTIDLDESQHIFIKDVDTFNTSGTETLVARIISKSAIINTSYGQLLNVLLGDADGSANIIQMVLKDKVAVNFSNSYDIGTLITISHFELRNPTQWNSAFHGSELHITPSTVFAQDNENIHGLSIPRQIVPTFIQPSQLKKIPNQSKVNLVGYVINTVSGVTSRNKKKIELEMFVGTYKILVTFWNGLVDDLEQMDLVGQTLIVFGGIINRWNSSITVNVFSFQPIVVKDYIGNSLEIKKLASWAKKSQDVKLKQLDKVVSMSQKGIDWSKVPEMSFEEVKQKISELQNQLSPATKPTAFKFKGKFKNYFKVTKASSETYPVLKTDSNGKALKVDGNSHYIHPATGQKVDDGDVTYSYRFSGWFQNVQSDPPRIAGTFFNKAAQQLWNMSAEDSFRLKQKDVFQYKNMVDIPKEQVYLVCLRVTVREIPNNTVVTRKLNYIFDTVEAVSTEALEVPEDFDDWNENDDAADFF